MQSLRPPRVHEPLSHERAFDWPAAGAVSRARAWVAGLPAHRLALLLGAVLFVLAAWPLAMTEVPPYQDLPNHLAAVTVLLHPERYPEFVSNGFFKTNTALFLWLCTVGPVVGLALAAKLFALVILVANAYVLPQVILRLGGRQRLLMASLFLWPMVHNWFVSAGMLDFALGFPLSLYLLLRLDQQRETPTARNALVIAVLSLATWYAHVFPYMMVNLLVLVHLLERGGGIASRLREGRNMLLPQTPAILLTIVSVVKHFTEPVGAMTGYRNMTRVLPVWELVYNLWAEWLYGFTWLSLSTLVPALALGYYAFRHRSENVRFFSPRAFALVILLIVFVPYSMTNWFHVNVRFVPFFWMAALVRVPERLPRRLAVLLGVSAVLYSASMGIDFVRLDQDRAKFTAGIEAVPEGARLLPLVFRKKLTSENTRSLQHAWGFYVTEKQTSAPLLFAHSRSFPVMYRTAPHPRFNHLVLKDFAPNMASPENLCRAIHREGLFDPDCTAEWHERWNEFWAAATPAFDHVLLWDASPEARALVPRDYHVVFQRDRLAIYARSPSASARNEPNEDRPPR